MAEIETVGDLRKVMNGLSDDFKIEFRVRKKVSEEVLAKRRYSYPYDTEYFDGIEFDDIGHSDKKLCLGITLDYD